jgi:hypothetical protein
MVVAIALPYFTFGEDVKMLKGLNLDAILLATLILTVFVSSMNIAEEIEGRTAITVLSKPIARRDYLIGKFLGIYLSAVLMALLLSILLAISVVVKMSWDNEEVETRPLPDDVRSLNVYLENNFTAETAKQVLPMLYFLHDYNSLFPGVLANLCQVMIVTAVSVALATRLPMIVNIVITAVVFFIGRQTHVLVRQSEGQDLVLFVAQVFSTILPGFNHYDVGPILVNEIEVPWFDFTFQTFLHAVCYSAIALLFGLILFEDRDLA